MSRDPQLSKINAIFLEVLLTVSKESIELALALIDLKVPTLCSVQSFDLLYGKRSNARVLVDLSIKLGS